MQSKKGRLCEHAIKLVSFDAFHQVATARLNFTNIKCSTVGYKSCMPVTVLRVCKKQVSRDLMCHAAKWCRETRDDHITAARETNVSHLRSHEEFMSALHNTYSV
jgi:hypothetical protein